MRQGNQLWNPSDDEALHNRSVNLYYCDRRVWDLMHAGISCDIQSQYSRGGRNMCSDSVYTCMCARKGEVNVEPTEISSLHHWVNGTADMSCDFTAASWRVTLKPTHEHIAHQSEWGVLRFRCLCWGKQWQPAPPRTHTQVHTCTPGMSAMSGDGNKKRKKKNPFGFMHLSQEA